MVGKNRRSGRVKSGFVMKSIMITHLAQKIRVACWSIVRLHVAADAMSDGKIVCNLVSKIIGRHHISIIKKMHVKNGGMTPNGEQDRIVMNVYMKSTNLDPHIAPKHVVKNAIA